MLVWNHTQSLESNFVHNWDKDNVKLNVPYLSIMLNGATVNKSVKIGLVKVVVLDFCFYIKPKSDSFEMSSSL